MIRAVLLTIHVAAGVAGLVLGPVAMLAPKRRGRHTRAGVWYQAAVAALAASACGFAALNWQALWWLALIGAVTEAAAIGGGWARRRRFAGWCAWHVRLMCGSYVSLLTALLVVNWRSPIVWVLPSLIATPLMRLLLVASEHRSKFRRMELAGGVRRAESRVAVSANR